MLVVTKYRTYLRSLLALLLFGFLFLGVFNFPSYRILISAGLLVYVVVLHYFKFFWLYSLMLMTVCLHLAPWTGRFIVDEFDFFLATTAIYFLFSRKESPPKNSLFVISLFFLFVLFVLSVNATWLRALTPLYNNFYLTPLNGFFVFKGIFWATFLVWVFNLQKQEDPNDALYHLFLASVITGIALLIVIMWEKQVLRGLFSDTSIYTKLGDLLNLRSAYRTTGLLTGMHTGGESIDGLYLFFLPLTVGACFFFKEPKLKLLSILGVVGVMYGVIMGFTRATYMASAICIATYVFFLYFPLVVNKRNQRSDNNRRGKTVFGPFYSACVTYGLLLLGVYNVHLAAGFYAEISLAIAYGSVVLLLSKKSIALPTKLTIWLLILVSYYFFNLDSFMNSQWVTETAQVAQRFNLGMLLMFLSFGLLFFTHYRSQEVIKTSEILIRTVVLALVTIWVAAVFSGARINIRAETSSSDLDMRLAHWKGIVDSGDWDLSSILFGHGLGSMPANYALTGNGRLSNIGNFYVDNKTDELIVFPGSDLMMSQRLHVESKSAYLIELSYSTTSDAKISFAFCKRNMIIFERWAGGCKEGGSVALNATPVSQIETRFVAITAHDEALFDLPTALTFRVSHGSAPVRLSSLSVKGYKGNELLANGSFKKGIDHWFFYYDFEHLEWHIKNIYLSVFYQYGVIGTLLVISLILRCFFDYYRHQQLFTIPSCVFMSFLLGQMALGFFSDPLDYARSSMWFFFILFGGMSFNSIPKTNRLGNTANVQ